jgi:phosphatidylglycerol:prolipoprotein diacylglycerol transferase
MIGGALAAVYIFRKHSLGIWLMADVIAPAIPVGLFLGRIGNFINGELYGRVTDLPWGVVFPSGGLIPRHPSQLYEAFLEGICLFLITLGSDRRKAPQGSVFWTVIAGYGLFRFIVEFFREPDQQLGFLWLGATMGQLLSLPMLLLGVVMIVRAYASKSKINGAA